MFFSDNALIHQIGTAINFELAVSGIIDKITVRYPDNTEQIYEFHSYDPKT